MKLYKVSLALLMGLGTLTSCENKLEVVDVNQQAASDFGSTASELEETVIAAYNHIRMEGTYSRVGYNYDVCGRGWGLTVNSCISRSIESMPDEQCSFKLGSGIFSHFYSQHNNNYDGYDFQHDIFNVTLPDGRSFSFCICDDDGNRKYLVSDKRPWKITCQQTTGITGFILTDDKGVKYFFTVMDNALLHTSSYRVAWYLSRIELPNTATPITFSYGKSIMQENQNISNKVLRLKRYFIYQFHLSEHGRRHPLQLS